MTKGVIYARYSSHNQTEQSIEGQVRVCQEYARAHDIEIIDIYADRAISGKTDNRPAFQKMIMDAELGTFKVIVLYNTDRFARDRYSTAVYKHKLRQSGVELKYATGSIPDGPEGIILEGLMESMAEYYSAELSAKIKRGMNESAAKCHTTGSNPGLGYKVAPDKSFVVDENGARAVRLIFDLFIAGRSKAEICNTLNAQGFRTSQGREFNKNSVDRILRNERYTGVYLYNGQRTEGGMPEIIPPDIWELSRQELQRRTKMKPRSEKRADFLLSGKVYCGHCKSQMIGISGTSHTGKKHHYYTCPKARKKTGCSKRAVNKDFIEELVVRETVNYVLRPDVIKEIARKCYEAQERSKNDDAIRFYQGKLASNKQAIANLIAALETGVVTKSLPARIKALEEEQVSIELEIDQLKRAAAELSVEQIEFFLESMAQPGDDFEAYKAKIINTFVSEIYLYDDKLLVFYNFRDESDDLRSREIEYAGAVSNGQEVDGFDYGLACSTIYLHGRTCEDKILAFAGSIALIIKTPTAF